MVAEQKIFYVRILEREFEKKQKKNSRYSLRAYSKTLQISPASLSLIMQGKRRLPVSKLRAIARRLELGPKETERFVFSGQSQSRSVAGSYELDDSRFNFVYESWEYFLLLALFRLDDFESTAVWLSKKSGIDLKRVEFCLRKLVNAGLLEKDDRGSFHRVHGNYHFFSKVPSESIRKAHAASLSVAQKKLESIPADGRDYSFLNIALDDEHFLKLKNMIFKFKQDITKLDEKSKKKTIYRVAIQCFPMST